MRLILASRSSLNNRSSRSSRTVFVLDEPPLSELVKYSM